MSYRCFKLHDSSPRVFNSATQTSLVNGLGYILKRCPTGESRSTLFYMWGVEGLFSETVSQSASCVINVKYLKVFSAINAGKDDIA